MKHVPLCYSKKMDLGSAKLAYDYLIKQIPNFSDKICNPETLKTSKKKESAEPIIKKLRINKKRKELENVMEEMEKVGNNLIGATEEQSRKLKEETKQLAKKLSTCGFKGGDDFREFDSLKKMNDFIEKMKKKVTVVQQDFFSKDELSVSELVSSLNILSGININNMEITENDVERDVYQNQSIINS
eukprot:Pgem_evm2s2083